MAFGNILSAFGITSDTTFESRKGSRGGKGFKPNREKRRKPISVTSGDGTVLTAEIKRNKRGDITNISRRKVDGESVHGYREVFDRFDREIMEAEENRKKAAGEAVDTASDALSLRDRHNKAFADDAAKARAAEARKEEGAKRAADQNLANDTAAEAFKSISGALGLREAHEKAFPASPAKAEGAGDDITKRLITGGANITVDKLASGGYLIDSTPTPTSALPDGSTNYQILSWVEDGDYVGGGAVNSWKVDWPRFHTG